MGRFSSRVETAKFTSSQNEDSQGNSQNQASSSDIHFHEEGIDSASDPEFQPSKFSHNITVQAPRLNSLRQTLEELRHAKQMNEPKLEQTSPVNQNRKKMTLM